MSHLDRGEVEGSYNFASYVRQRRKMMDFWSAWIVSGCPEVDVPDNVVKLPMARAS